MVRRIGCTWASSKRWRWFAAQALLSLAIIFLFMGENREIETLLDSGEENSTHYNESSSSESRDPTERLPHGPESKSEDALHANASEKSSEGSSKQDDASVVIPKTPEHPAEHPKEEDPVVTPEKTAEDSNKKEPEQPASAPQPPAGTPEYLIPYPNRDIPRDKFPAGAWQTDTGKVKAYLNDASKLIDTAMEAILAEYGRAGDEPFQERMSMFELDFIELPADTKMPGHDKGGYTTERSFDGLVRRILHALMTNDTFTVVLGGHSAAAAHGNHFKQSYMMQFYEVMKPVFEQLGVKLVSRNLAQGGLGTLQHAMGAGTIYGDEMDMIIWDSGMTEGREADHIDVFHRQALIGGNRVPVLWGGTPEGLEGLHTYADADIIQWGTGMSGIPTITSVEQAGTFPYFSQYILCSSEADALCKDRQNKYNGVCWIDRPDVTPPKKQKDQMGGQVGWHPGFRAHRLQSRVLAFTVLQALRKAIKKWNEVEGQVLADSDWHVTEYYENIRTKLRAYKSGPCYKIKGSLPTRFCNTAIKGATTYTPRANPGQTDLLNLLKPASDGYIPANEQTLLYDGPDVPNPHLDVPEGEVDVVRIITGGGRQLRVDSSLVDSHSLGLNEIPRNQFEKEKNLGGLERRLHEPITVGKGWQVSKNTPNGFCGGEYDDICGRLPDNDCLLYGHHDARGGLVGNEFAGWVVMELKDLKEGIIVIKVEDWLFPEDNSRTQKWATINNERNLKKKEPPPFCDDFFFDFAINGNITSWNKTQYEKNRIIAQRTIELLTFLDDPKFTNGKTQNVEVAFRLRGCGKTKTFKLTHVYWA